MILYVIVVIATVFAASFVKPLPILANGKKKWHNQITRRQMLNLAAFLFIFTTLFIVSAIRLDVGQDYGRYVWFMHMVVYDGHVPTEIGFNVLVKLIYWLFGYGNFLIVFAVIAFLTIMIFLWTLYRDSENFWFSFFLFMSFGYYFQSFSTVRYYLAVAVALYAIPYVLKKQWLNFIGLILLGSTFHKSLLLVIPLYFLASLKWKKWMVVIMALFLTTFFYLQDFYLRAMVYLYPSYRDTEFLEGGTSIINIIRCSGILVFSLIYYQEAIKDNQRNQFYFYCNIGAFILYTCCSFIPVISRIGYLLTVTHIFFLPAIVLRIKDKRQKTFFAAAIILAAIWYFAMFLYKAPDYGVRLIPYQTFLFHEMTFTWAN